VENREDHLGVSHLIVSGESSWDNLNFTVAHQANGQGWLHEIAGVYAQCGTDAVEAAVRARPRERPTGGSARLTASPGSNAATFRCSVSLGGSYPFGFFPEASPATTYWGSRPELRKC